VKCCVEYGGNTQIYLVLSHGQCMLNLRTSSTLAADCNIIFIQCVGDRNLVIGCPRTWDLTS
jgi:hypothetical protein